MRLDIEKLRRDLDQYINENWTDVEDEIPDSSQDKEDEPEIGYDGDGKVDAERTWSYSISDR